MNHHTLCTLTTVDPPKEFLDYPLTRGKYNQQIVAGDTKRECFVATFVQNKNYSQSISFLKKACAGNFRGAGGKKGSSPHLKVASPLGIGESY